MNIVTKSIKDDLEVQFNKPIEEISPEELSKVKNITINRIGFGTKIQKTDYNEILYFDNLEELNIFNCMINKILMSNITKLKKLRILKIYNSDFVDFIDDMFINLPLEKLTISNCLGLKNATLKDLEYLELKNIDIDFLIKNVEILNISNIGTNIKMLNLVNVKKIIMSEKDYNEGRNFDNIKADIIIVNDRMEKIREIRNG